MIQQVNCILQLCARLDSHPEQQAKLISACSALQDWSEMLPIAEEQGMAPLLYHHLVLAQVTPSTTFLRGLTFLSLRHRQANKILMKSLSEVLFLFEKAGIKSLVVKGAALCNTLYSEIGLRPMRDIDLLLRKEDVFRAHKLLQKVGFNNSSIPLPKDHYHLQLLSEKVAGMEVSVELHHGLFPQLPPFYNEFSFEESFENGITFEVNGVPARTLANEEMLWHLFQHGFHSPLTYEPYKLISATDIIALVEKNASSLDWERIKNKYPQLYKSLPVFHYLSPWSEKTQQYIHLEATSVPSGVGESYCGWPRQKFQDALKERSILKVLRNTLFPSRWWCMLYYSTGKALLPVIWCRLVQHPVHLLRWIKISSRVFFTEKRAEE